MAKSLIELAHEFVCEQKEPVSFAKIWEYVKAHSELSEEVLARKAGQFFTNMMLDGRFVTLGDNDWDLRTRHTFDKVHIDMKDVYSDVETSDDDSEEKAEEEEYDETFEETSSDDESSKGEESEEESSNEF